MLIGACFGAAVLAFPWRVDAQEPANIVIAPPRDGLLPVSLPRLDVLESQVASQVRERQQSFQSLIDSAQVSGATLADAYGSLGRLLHAYEFFEPAESAYLNAARLAPGDVTWPHLLGHLYQQTGRLDDAAGRFEHAIRLQPDDRAAVVRLGQVYLGLNRLQEAREQFENVAAVFPALAQHGLGEVALRERRFAAAAGHFRAALDRVPQATSIHYSLAMAYRGLGRLDEARSHLEQRGANEIRVGDPIVDGLQALIRGERGLVVQGRRAYEAGRYQEAANAFAKALEAAPASATARVNLGLAQLQLGDTAAALENLRSAFEQAPDDANTSRELVRVLIRLRRDDEAILVLTKARSVNPDDEETVVGLSILMAEQQRFGEAAAVLGEANRRFPERIAIATTLARLLASSPDRSIRDGRRAFDLAMRVYTVEPTPVHGETIALALAELERCDEALTWMKRAVAEAEQQQDAREARRLRSEIARYETPPCRSPGQ